MKKKSLLLPCMFVAVVAMNTACSDFFEQDSDHVIFADGDHLNNATDTIYSVTGILNKLQMLSDRTILLGEARADLVDINQKTSSDLRNVALFNVGDSNQYNVPKDYYAVINNCNYFIAKVDTALKNNRNEKIFESEYAAVKGIRAWTYLQLAINYGKVPFVTEPILSKVDGEKKYPMADLHDICTYFINDIAPFVNVPMPSYGSIRNTDSRLFYFPIYVLLGDMNLWIGNYKEAALNYYKYINNRNGSNTFYTTGLNAATWPRDINKYISVSNLSYATNVFSDESFNTNSEIVTMIPGDSIRAEGNYSELRNIFNSNDDNDYTASLNPSQSMMNLSAAQIYCNRSTVGNISYAPSNLTDNYSGDLRLSSVYSTQQGNYNKKTYQMQLIRKYATRNVHIYRRMGVYLRLAEALNRAGLPQVSYAILKTGLNNEIIDTLKLSYPNDSTWLNQLDFSNTLYAPRVRDINRANTIGIHSRGCGWTEYNDYYPFPDDSTLTGDARLQYSIEKVEDMIMDENALEMAFEGTRFYDLMRVALRRNDPSYLADRIYKRRGADKVNEVKSEIKKDLTDTKSWYLKWNGQIGY